jgi:hypothetical protein
MNAFTDKLRGITVLLDHERPASFIMSISLSTKFTCVRTFPHLIEQTSQGLSSSSGKEGAGSCRMFDKTHILNRRSCEFKSHEGRVYAQRSAPTP